MSIPVRISQRALDQIRRLRSSMNLNDETYLRIGVKGGKGCMVVEKLLGFDKKNEGDEEFILEDIHIIIRRGESLYVAGMEVDYIDDGKSRGFVFQG